MRKLMLLGLLCSSSALFAASTTITNHTLRTNTGGGSCLSFMDDDDSTTTNSTTTNCHDGDNATTVNDVRGCISATGTGQCFIGDLPGNVYPLVTATCPGAHGHTFDLTAGPGGHCTTTVVYGVVVGTRCYDANGIVVSEMSCTCNDNQGCCLSETSGKGTCGNERDLHPPQH